MTPFSLLDHWTRKLYVEFPIHICANIIIVDGRGCQKLEQVWFCFVQLLTHAETVHKHVTATCAWNLLDTVQHQHLDTTNQCTSQSMYKQTIFYFFIFYFIKSTILAGKCIYYTYSRNVVPIWQINMQWEVSSGVGQVVGIILWKDKRSVPAIEYLDTNISWACSQSCS